MYGIRAPFAHHEFEHLLKFISFPSPRTRSVCIFHARIHLRQICHLVLVSHAPALCGTNFLWDTTPQFSADRSPLYSEVPHSTLINIYVSPKTGDHLTAFVERLSPGIHYYWHLPEDHTAWATYMAMAERGRLILRCSMRFASTAVVPVGDGTIRVALLLHP
ncbi:hypothetical protein DENSPDRAFT_274616 [Dentipellis sp. KUC8613]|nr:hypothetical protein DENSPDRAFT_274616 [Dentipellis sp. KUC8613]